MNNEQPEKANPLTYQQFEEILSLFKSGNITHEKRRELENAYFGFCKFYPESYCECILRAMQDQKIRSMAATLFRRDILNNETESALMRMSDIQSQINCANTVLTIMYQIAQTNDNTARHIAYAIGSVYTHFVEKGYQFPQLMNFIEENLNEQSTPATRRCIMVILGYIADLQNNKLREIGIEKICAMICYGLNNDTDDSVAVEAARACINLLLPNPEDDDNIMDDEMQDDMDDYTDQRLLDEIINLIPNGNEGIITIVNSIFCRLQRMATTMATNLRNNQVSGTLALNIEDMLKAVNELIEYLAVIINPCLNDVISLMINMLYLSNESISCMSITVVTTICSSVKQLKKKAAALISSFFSEHLLPLCFNYIKDDPETAKEWLESIYNDLEDDLKIDGKLIDAASGCIDSISINLGKKIIFPVIVKYVDETIKAMNHNDPSSWRYGYMAGLITALAIEGCTSIITEREVSQLTDKLQIISQHPNPRVRHIILHAVAQLSIDCEDLVKPKINDILKNIFYPLVNDPIERISNLIPVCIMNYIEIMDVEDIVANITQFGGIIDRCINGVNSIPAATSALMMYNALLRELESNQSEILAKNFMSVFYQRFQQVIVKLNQTIELNKTSNADKLLFAKKEADYVSELIEAIAITAQTFPQYVDENFFNSVMTGLINLYTQSNIDSENQITRQCIFSFVRMQNVNINGFMAYSSTLIPRLLDDLRKSYLVLKESNEENEDTDGGYEYGFDSTILDQQCIVIQCFTFMINKKPELFANDMLYTILSTIIFRGYPVCLEPEIRSSSLKLLATAIKPLSMINVSYVPELLRMLCNNFNESFQLTEWTTATAQEICDLIESFIDSYSTFVEEVVVPNNMDEAAVQNSMLQNNNSLYASLYKCYIDYRISKGDEFDEKTMQPSQEAMNAVKIPFNYRYFIDDFCLKYLVRIQEKLYKTLESDIQYAQEEEDDQDAIIAAIERSNKNYVALMDSVCENYAALVSNFKGIMAPYISTYDLMIEMWMNNKGCSSEKKDSPIRAKFDSLGMSLLCDCVRYVPDYSLTIVEKHWAKILSIIEQCSTDNTNAMFDDTQINTVIIVLYCVKSILIAYRKTNIFQKFIADINNALEMIKSRVNSLPRSFGTETVVENVLTLQAAMAKEYPEQFFVNMQQEEFWINWANGISNIKNDFEECGYAMRIIIDKFLANDEIFMKNVIHFFTALCVLFFGNFHKRIVGSEMKEYKQIVNDLTGLLNQAGSMIESILANPNVSDIVKQNINATRH